MSSAVSPPSFGAYLRHCRDKADLSRPDLADAADTSASYVAKLEQGAATHPSAARIDQLASALKLDDIRRQHLHDLATFDQVPPACVDDHVPLEQVSDVMRQHIDALVPHLVGYVDVAWNVLHPNAEYRRIFRHLADPDVGNVLVWFFHVPEARAIMQEWEAEARMAVARFRGLLVRHPGSRRFDRLLNRLSSSAEFRRMWDEQEVMLGRDTPSMLLRDLDRGQDIRLLAQVYPAPNPTQHVQLFLGTRTDLAG
jgi:transcriptional regulator with XRE-family HTH domain